jgi:hypothetical protein
MNTSFHLLKKTHPQDNTTTNNNNNNNGLIMSRINIVALLIVIHHTLWLMPLTTLSEHTTQIFNNKEIESIIKSLKLKNTCGYDDISTKLLKITSVYITSPLNHICTTSILSGSFPQCLKYSIVKPLFKKGDRTDVSNYRPNSILTAFSKFLEKVIYNRLLEHIFNNNILVKNNLDLGKM